MRIVGLMAVYNESDIIGQVIDHLISQGIPLVIIDNGSTDGSYEICSEYVGRGVLTIKRVKTEKFELALLLQKLHEIALKYNPDWELLNGADEFLESPYRGLTLKEAIELEAKKGYNLIQFNNFEFYPTEKDDSSEQDVRKRIKYYSWSDDFQFRCWKVYPGMTIHEGGGHIPKFPEGISIKVSPNKFIIRHYKIRSYEQGLKKVFYERLPRYSPTELKKGWHIHYNNFKRDKNYFVIDSSKLTRYDEDGNWNLTKTFDGTFGAWNPPPSDNERTQQLLQFINSLEMKCSSLVDQLEKVRQELASRDLRIRDLEVEKSSLIDQLEKAKQELRVIKDSFGYSLMRFYTRVLHRLLPDGTRRGELRKILVVSVHIARKKGLRSLFRQVWRKIKEKKNSE